MRSAVPSVIMIIFCLVLAGCGQAERSEKMPVCNTPLLSDGKELIIETIVQITENVTYPADVMTRVLNGGGFNISDGKTLTISGPFDAGLYQIFFGSGTVTGLKMARPEWFGSGTTGINKAISSVKIGGIVKGTAGNSYSWLSVVGKSDTTLDMTGCFISKDGGGVSTNIIDLNGTFSGVSTTLTANAAQAQNAIAVASNSGFSVGDFVLIRDASYKYSTKGRNQEINKIIGISGTNITLTNNLVGAYTTAATAEMVKVMPVVNMNIVGGTWTIPAETRGGGISGILSYNCTVKYVDISGSYDYPAIYFGQSAYISIENSYIHDGQHILDGNPNLGLGVELYESTVFANVSNNRIKSVMQNVFSDNVRHCIFTSNIIHGAIDDAINTHGTGCEFVTISDNIITSSKYSGIAVGNGSSPASDNDIIVSNNIISNVGQHGIVIASGSSTNNRIAITGNKIRNIGLTTASSMAINASKTSGISISDNDISGVSTNANYGILMTTISNADVRDNKVSDFPNGYGIAYSTGCSNINVESNRILSIVSHNIYSIGVNTGVRILNNICDDSTFSLAATDSRSGNYWGALRESTKGSATVADGGTLTFAQVLTATPTSVKVSPTVSGEMVSVTSANNAGCVLAIKKHDNTSGTSQTVYYEASI